jgi:hypothetical protein
MPIKKKAREKMNRGDMLLWNKSNNVYLRIVLILFEHILKEFSLYGGTREEIFEKKPRPKSNIHDLRIFSTAIIQFSF